MLLAFVASLMGGLLAFLIQTTIGLLGFWLDEVTSLNDLLNIATITIGGRAVPVFLYPVWLFTLAQALPFRYLTSFPTEIVTNQLNSNQTIIGLFLQSMWIGLFLGLCWLLWLRGMRSYTTSGG